MKHQQFYYTDVLIDDRQIVCETDKAVCIQLKPTASMPGWKFWQPKKLTVPAARQGRLFIKVSPKMIYRLHISGAKEDVYETDGKGLIRIIAGF